MRHFFIRRFFEPLIREFGVDLILQGHEHCYARMISKDKNKTPITPIYIISNSSFKDYHINKKDKYDRFGDGMRFYQTIDISSDTLLLKTNTETGDLYDCIRIVKNDKNLQITD